MNRAIVAKPHYATGILLVATAALIAWLFPALQEVVSILFVAPVILTAWLGGLGPGLMATILAAVAMDYFILEPRFALEMTSVRNLLDLAVFGLVAIVTSGLADRRQKAERAARLLATQLQEADRHKDEFFAVLSHELRNSLAPVQIAAQLIQMLPASKTDDDLRLASSAIENQVKQLARLIDDLLDISRVRTGKIHLHKERVDLCQVAARAHAASDPMIRQRGHCLTLALPDEPLWIDADPTRLQQVLTNLLGNAAKYTDPPGEIRLSVKREADEAVFEVEDNGMGLAPERLSQIFELFMQIDSSLDHSQGGLGIGLSLVRRLVELHGGAVNAESEGLGRGSRFTVRLPGVQPAPVLPEAAVETVRVTAESVETKRMTPARSPAAWSQPESVRPQPEPPLQRAVRNPR